MITKRTLTIAQRFLTDYSKLCQENPYFNGYWDSEDNLLTVAKRLKLGRVKTNHGCYRNVIIFKTFVFKVPRGNDSKRRFQKEVTWITKMRKTKKYRRHFPDTRLIKIGKDLLMVQEVVNTNQNGKYHLHEHVENLANQLGIDDCHCENFGWKGSRGREYPVFFDVEFTVSKHKAHKCRRRSWFV